MNKNNCLLRESDGGSDEKGRNGGDQEGIQKFNGEDEYDRVSDDNVDSDKDGFDVNEW